MSTIKSTIQPTSTINAEVNPSSKITPTTISIHNVDANSVGLGNVTNESKATMFSNPNFTGVVNANEIVPATNLLAGLVIRGNDESGAGPGGKVVIKGGLGGESEDDDGNVEIGLTSTNLVDLGPTRASSLEVTGNILPDTDIAHDLGSATKRWRDLYVSGGTIHLGDVKVKEESGSFKIKDASDNAVPIGDAIFTGNVTVEEKLVHLGDTDTQIRFEDIGDTITMYTGGQLGVTLDRFQNWTFSNGNRVQITNPTGPNQGLRFTHTNSGVANNEFNMYYAGSSAGAPFVLNKEGTGNAEIIFFSTGDVNINGGYQGSGTGNEDNNVGIGVNGQTRKVDGTFNTSAKPTNKLHVFEETGKFMGSYTGSTFGLTKSGALVRIESDNGENLFLDGRTLAADNSLNLVAESAITLGPEKKLTTSFTEPRTVNYRPVKFASYSTTQRDELTPINGDVIYNATVDKFQGYAGGAWVDLH